MTSRDYLLLGLRNVNTIIQAPRLLPLTFSKFIQDQDVFFSRMQGRTQGGSWGAHDPRFVSHVLSKQPTTGGKNDMKIW